MHRLVHNLFTGENMPKTKPLEVENPFGVLRDWTTDEEIGPATRDDWEAYAEASAMVPNGAIHVDGRLCWVEGGPCHPVRGRTWNGPEWNQSDDGGPYDPQAYQPPHGGIC
jgi:hypothetical protein